MNVNSGVPTSAVHEVVPFEVRARLKTALAWIVSLEVLVGGSLFLGMQMSGIYARWLQESFPSEPPWGIALVLCSPLLMLVPYLGSIRGHWVVGPHGIDIHRGGTLRRSIAWTEMVSLEILPVGAIIKHADNRIIGEQLAFLAQRDIRRLRETWHRVRPLGAGNPSPSFPLRHLIRAVLTCGGVSLACIAIVLTLGNAWPLARTLFGVGSLAATCSASVGLWAAFRQRSVHLLIAVGPSVLALAGWVWIVVNALRVR